MLNKEMFFNIRAIILPYLGGNLFSNFQFILFFISNKKIMRRFFILLFLAGMTITTASSCFTPKQGCLSTAKMVGYR